MARITQSSTWLVPRGDFAALRLTAEVFMAQNAIKVVVRNGGILIGKQGSAMTTCLCLLRFAPTRVLPKRIRIDVQEEQGQVRFLARFEDSFPIAKLNGLAASRYERQFSEWLKHLQGQVVPGDIALDEKEAAVALAVAAPERAKVAATPGYANGHAPETDIEQLVPVSPAIPRPDAVVSPAVAEDTTSSEGESKGAVTGAPAAEEPPLAVEAENAIDEAPSVDDALGQISSDFAVGGASRGSVAEAEIDDAEIAAPAQPTDAIPAIDGPEKAASPPASAGAAKRGGRFRLPFFGRRGLAETETSPGGALTAAARREAAAANAALGAKAWHRGLLHFDAAILALQGKTEPGRAESIEVGQIYLGRGIARFTQTQSSLDATGPSAKLISDYQIAIEAMRLVNADYDESIRLNPGSANALFRRGEAHLFAARCERGSRNFRQASRELEQAVADFTRATELTPSFAAAFALRAIARYLLQQDDEAEADVGRAVALGANPVTVWRAIKASRSWARSNAESGSAEAPRP